MKHLYAILTALGVTISITLIILIKVITMNAVFVIIYHTNDEFSQYQIPVATMPAEIRGLLYRYNGTIFEYGDASDQAKAAIEVINFLALPEIEQYKISKEKVPGTDCAIVAVFNIGTVL